MQDTLISNRTGVYSRVLHTGKLVYKVGIKYLPLLIALLSTAAILYIFIARLRFPGQLEWMEGESVDHVAWLREGNWLYQAPTLEMIPAIYTPLYYYVGALATIIKGDSLAYLRLISLLSTLGICTVLSLWVHKRGERPYAALIVPSLYLTTFFVTGTWMDIARPDSLFIFLALLASYLFYKAESWSLLIWAGLFAILSFYTKQVGAPLLAIFMVIAPILHGKRGWIWSGGMALVLLLSYVGLDALSHGWFRFYTLTEPSLHPIDWTHTGARIREQFIVPLSGLLAFAAIGISLGLSYLSRKQQLIISGTTIGLLVSCILPLLKEGGYVNDVLPGVAALALLGGFGIHALITGKLSEKPLTGYLLVSVLLLLNIGITMRPVSSAIPTEADTEAFTQLQASMYNLKGPILMPEIGYMARKAGKGFSAHAMTITDLYLSKDSHAIEVFEASAQPKFVNHYYKTIILSSGFTALNDSFGEYYTRSSQTTVIGSPDFTWPAAGRIPGHGIFIPR